MVPLAIVALQVGWCVMILQSSLVHIVLAVMRFICVSKSRPSLRIIVGLECVLLGRLDLSLTYLFGILTSCTLLMET